MMEIDGSCCNRKPEQESSVIVIKRGIYIVSYGNSSGNVYQQLCLLFFQNYIAVVGCK